jgi:hypothetical protein
MSEYKPAADRAFRPATELDGDDESPENARCNNCSARIASEALDECLDCHLERIQSRNERWWSK